MVLAIVLPVVLSVVLIMLMLKFVPGLLNAFRSLCSRQQDENTKAYIDLEVGSGVLLSPEPYRVTWLTPESQEYSPFDTPTTAMHPELRVIARPPRSPRIMTSLVSPIKTGCSSPKRAIRASSLSSVKAMSSLWA
ncbi:hypothetical protein PC129_g13656 [Phytophthora cactorum]|uniref:Uncharacterized protein n=1 Tax=Phytophthora cactorum TaxID=29920 RepID=A0A329SAV6_9STRA|nr:hypothetical protein Pcac1_g16363 [Phytophthora cactorum]KAG2811526.1 hypothetical protein PC112_g15562 [Phytophthora cactorum]KAG2813137.1 hypothetical protein PC111_g14514 [Phytophthora cactorum]KAG2851768.1 hypothetical protein PC113_g15613 [Phytophthora cactorum]KAG2890881.1 hypothetical protein PC114_g17241 [Phytophthora cactorum]